MMSESPEETKSNKHTMKKNRNKMEKKKIYDVIIIKNSVAYQGQ